MKKVTADIFPIHAISKDDAKSFVNWAYLMLGKTQFDAKVMRHPRMCMTRASFDGKPGLFVPIQPVLMFDALTPDPSLTKIERALAMSRISDMIEKQVMPDTGMHDAYFYTNDNDEAEVAARHGWTEVKGVRLMRKRISAPEPVDSTMEPAKETSNV